MKEVNYYCDICKKKINKPTEEKSCIAIKIGYTHDWEKELPLSEQLQDIRVCRECGIKINDIIRDMKLNYERMDINL